MGQKKKNTKKSNKQPAGNQPGPGITSEMTTGTTLISSTVTSETVQNDRKLRDEAEKEAQQAMQVAFIKLMNEENPTYQTEDSDQTVVTGDAAIKLKWKWSSGLDWNPNNMLLSSWMRSLAAGDYDSVLAEIQKTPANEVKNLLERRETLYNFSALFHLIKGASATLNETGTGFNTKCKFVDRSKQPKHLQCAVKLIELGANVNAKDMLGATPLFYCVMRYRNPVTLKIAKLLLDNGAEANAVNRLGETALLQPIMMKRLDCAKLLLENGSDPTIRDLEGSCVQDMAVMDSDVKKLLSSVGQKKDTDVSTLCALCGQASTSRCTACFVIRYCSKECQLAHWDKHKKTCKETKKKFTQISLVDTGDIEDKLPKDNFVGKVQINSTGESRVMSLNHQTNGFLGNIALTDPVFVLLEGNMKTNEKGYFQVVVDKDSHIKINANEMLENQDW